MKMPDRSSGSKGPSTYGGFALALVVAAVAIFTVTSIKVTSFSLGGVAAVLLLALALLFLAVAVWNPVEKHDS
jgi:hypothetical protein